MDEAGQPRIAFGQTGVTVAQRDLAGAWTLTNVATGTSQNVALVMAGSAWHVAYYDTAADDLRYASNTIRGLALVNDSVDIKGGAGNYTSVAVDAAGTPHAAYRDYDNSTLKYARKVGGVWYRTQADTSASVGSWVSIVAAPDGIHIAHRDSTNTALRHTQLVSGTFTTEFVDNAANVGEYTDMAVAPNGTLHIAYRDASNSQLKEAYRLAGSTTWVTSIPDTVGSVGTYASVAVDRNGDVHLGYRNSSDTDTKYTNNVGKSLGLWNLPVTAEAVGNAGTYASLVVDNDTNAYIAFKYTSTNDLRVATNASPSHAWTSTSIETSGNVGGYASLARSGLKNLYLGYKDQTNNDVKLALNFDAWGWQLFPAVDTVGNVGDELDAAVGPTSVVYISYRDTSTNQMRVAVVTPTNTVDQDCDGY